ncbi:MAG: recombinase family protein [Nitrosomonas sp.]|nr:recombinase family protein [Nitrosomonas sp.]
MLRNPIYAGYIEYKPWGVSLRKGQHEGIISYETFLKIQERLEGRAYAPTRKDLNLDFPLRGSVSCVCGNALTSCWSKSETGKRHAYYLCQNRQCEYKGKSIRRDVIEGEFEALLKQLTPTRNLMAVASDMFKTLWEHRKATLVTRRKTLKQECNDAQRKIDQLLDRIVDADSPLVAKALEKRIEELQSKKLVIEEKLSRCGRPLKTYDEMYRTSLRFLQEPHKIWACGRFEDKRVVLKLTFTDRLTYVRNEGYRIPELSLPFKLLGYNSGQNMLMVPRGGIEPP